MVDVEVLVACRSVSDRRHRRPLHAEADGSQVELEAGFISDRTKAALVAAKRRGKKLGFSSWREALREGRQKGAEANAEGAAAHAAEPSCRRAPPHCGPS